MEYETLDNISHVHAHRWYACGASSRRKVTNIYGHLVLLLGGRPIYKGLKFRMVYRNLQVICSSVVGMQNKSLSGREYQTLKWHRWQCVVSWCRYTEFNHRLFAVGSLDIRESDSWAGLVRNKRNFVPVVTAKTITANHARQAVAEMSNHKWIRRGASRTWHSRRSSPCPRRTDSNNLEWLVSGTFHVGYVWSWPDFD